ncbi:hypothetical protein ACE6H2_023048 [Prunus campanulata]
MSVEVRSSGQPPKYNVQDDVNIADDADDEAEEEDEEQQVDEEEAVNVDAEDNEEEAVNDDAEDDDEERLQFIDSDYEQPGRPRTSRQKEPDEIPKNATKMKRYGIVISCKSCGGEGHNSATCGAEGHTGERGEQARGRGRAIRVRGRGRGTSMPSVPVRQPDQADTSIQDRPFARRGGQMSELTRQLAQTGATLQGIQIGHASQPNSENVPLPKRPRPWRV